MCVLYVYSCMQNLDKIRFQKISLSVITVINKPIYTTRNSLKNILFYLVCVSLSSGFSFSQSETVDLLSCKQGTFTQYFFPSGELSSEGCLVDGKADGEWKSYYQSGVIKSKGQYLQNEVSGSWVFYFEDGVISNTVDYRFGLKNGEEKVYSEEGILLRKTNWKEDVKIDVEERFYGSGELEFEIAFQGGVKEGKSIQFAKDGRMIAFMTYKNDKIYSVSRFNRFNKAGEKTGVWKEFYESLNLKEEGIYADDKKHGVFRFYSTRGNLDSLKRYEFGVEVIDEEIDNNVDVVRNYHSNGTIEEETVFVNGLRNGVSREYDSSGQIIGGGIYVDDILMESGKTDKQGRYQGDWELFYEDGSVRAKGAYVDGLKHGPWVYYFESGELEQKGSFDMGELDDQWTWYTLEGELRREENYRSGEEDGFFMELDEDGEVLLKGEYKRGRKEGMWIYHVNDHREEGEFVSGKKEGEWNSYYLNDQQLFKGSYSFGEPVGTHKNWQASGVLLTVGGFKDGVMHGKWVYYNNVGEVDRVYVYKYGALVKVDGRRIAKNK